MSDQKSSIGETLGGGLLALLLLGWLGSKCDPDRATPAATSAAKAPNTVATVASPAVVEQTRTRSCVVAPSEIERSAWIEAAIRKGDCTSFPTYVPQDSPRDQIIERLSHYDAIRSKAHDCATEAESAFAAAMGSNLRGEEFCRRARQYRDWGVGAPGKLAAGDLLSKLKGMIEEGETIVGVWVDETHPLGFIAITKVGLKLYEYTLSSDGQGWRGNTLEAIKPPRGAKRAWQTAGLTRKTEVVLGERQATFVDKDGNSHDKHRFVERADGKLEAYEEGVGLPGTKPWGIARPIEP